MHVYARQGSVPLGIQGAQPPFVKGKGNRHGGCFLVDQFCAWEYFTAVLDKYHAAMYLMDVFLCTLSH
jgi:hypothetical protein